MKTTIKFDTVGTPLRGRIWIALAAIFQRPITLTADKGEYYFPAARIEAAACAVCEYQCWITHGTNCVCPRDGVECGNNSTLTRIITDKLKGE